MSWFLRVSQYEDLSWVLSGPNNDRRVGREVGKPIQDGIVVYRSEFGSYRYVMYREGQPIAGLQVVSDGERAIAANVYTAPEFRRQGLATELYQRALRDFPNLRAAEHRTPDGIEWVDSLSTEDGY